MQGAPGPVLRLVAFDDAVSAAVRLPVLYQAELRAAQAEFVSYCCSTTVDVPALVVALVGLFVEIATSAASANPTNPIL